MYACPDGLGEDSPVRCVLGHPDEDWGIQRPIPDSGAAFRDWPLEKGD